MIKNIIDYIKEHMDINESNVLYIDMKHKAELWMSGAVTYEEMMLVLYSVLQGLIGDLESRDKHQMTPREAKNVNRMLKLLDSMMDDVEKNK